MALTDLNPMIVLLPVLVIWVIVISTYVFVKRRDGRMPADDIGLFWLVVLGLYTTFPPLSWLIQGGRYGLYSDSRLLRFQPSTVEVFYLLTIAVAYAGGFAGVYVIFRQRVQRPLRFIFPRVSNAKFMGAFAIVLLVQAVILVLNSVGFIPSAGSYIESYSVMQELPLVVRQILKTGEMIASVATLVVLVAVLQRWPRHRLLVVIYLIFLLVSFDLRGSRTELVTGLFVFAIAWHVVVRSIPARLWFAGGFLGLVIFHALGLYRAVAPSGNLDLFAFHLLNVGEFDTLWANAIELLRAKQSGMLDVPLAARFGEIWSFVPSQLLPFQKMSLANWYVGTYYPEYGAQGGGLAFGAISQAVIGGGILEAALRGAILGAVAGWLMKWYRVPSTAWWRLPLYLYIFVFAFLSVRDTTFRPFGDVAQLVLPALILVAFSAAALAVIKQTNRHSPTAIIQHSRGN